MEGIGSRLEILYLMRIVIFEDSNFSYVKFRIGNEIYKVDCVSVDGEISYFVPYSVLNPIQTVFYKYYDKNFKNVIISTPTSSGKSGVIYLTCYKHWSQNFKGFIYSAPTKALIEEKYGEFRKFFLPRNVSVDIKTGDYISKRIDPLTKIVCTTFDSLAIAMRNRNEWIYKDFIVIDEVHSLLSGLGKYLLEILALCKSFGINLVLLSATLPIIDDLEKYLNSELVITSDYRPVKLNKSFVFIDKKFLNDVDLGIDVTKFKTVEERSIVFVLINAIKRAIQGEKVIIFVWSKSLGWKFLYFASLLGLRIFNETINFQISNFANLDLSIAFHNADIPFDERQKIEQEFRNESSDLRILIATQTLSMGVNLPADTAFINIKAFYSHDGFQVLPSLLDILQEEGRVGRFGLRDEGNSFRIFWSVPQSLRDKLLRIEKINNIDYFSNISFYNIFSILLLSSINFFGDYSLVFNSFVANYYSRDELEKLIVLYTNLLEKWGFIVNSRLTEKAIICLQSNIPPHFLQGFFQMRRYKGNFRIHYVDFAYLLGLRGLLYTKNFLSFSEMYGNHNWKDLVQRYFDLTVDQVSYINELIEFVVENYIGLFSDNKLFSKLVLGCWEFIAWCLGIISELYDKPIGEYSTLKNDINHLVWILYRVLSRQDLDLEKDLIKRYELSLIYGCNPNYSIVGKIRDIGYKRLALISRKMRMLSVEFIKDEKHILEFQEEFYKDKDLRSVFNIIVKSINGIL